jgi:hypothetical protein
MADFKACPRIIIPDRSSDHVVEPEPAYVITSLVKPGKHQYISTLNFVC